jgi:hypothetical protein
VLQPARDEADAQAAACSQEPRRRRGNAARGTPEGALPVARRRSVRAAMGAAARGEATSAIERRRRVAGLAGE